MMWRHVPWEISFAPNAFPSDASGLYSPGGGGGGGGVQFMVCIPVNDQARSAQSDVCSVAPETQLASPRRSSQLDPVLAEMTCFARERSFLGGGRVAKIKTIVLLMAGVWVLSDDTFFTYCNLSICVYSAPVTCSVLTEQRFPNFTKHSFLFLPLPEKTQECANSQINGNMWHAKKDQFLVRSTVF